MRVLNLSCGSPIRRARTAFLAALTLFYQWSFEAPARGIQIWIGIFALLLRLSLPTALPALETVPALQTSEGRPSLVLMPSACDCDYER
jgi:hypothetical protein